MSFDEMDLEDMRFDDLKLDIVEAGLDGLGPALTWAKENITVDPVPLRLKGAYNVTFEDPSKPQATVFKKFGCFDGDEFQLTGFRKTAKNFIMRFEPGPNVKRNMARHRVGAGLQTEWQIAEFTMRLMNEDRMNATEFMRSVCRMRRQFLYKGLNVDKLYADTSAGSW